MGVANSGSVGRGKRFGGVGRPARTADNAANAMPWGLRLDSTIRSAPAVADMRSKAEVVGRNRPRSAKA
jgi:hypothetical protein